MEKEFLVLNLAFEGAALSLHEIGAADSGAVLGQRHPAVGRVPRPGERAIRERGNGQPTNDANNGKVYFAHDGRSSDRVKDDVAITQSIIQSEPQRTQRAQREE